MGFRSDLLPTNILKCVSAEERKRMGKAGQLPEETIEKADLKTEKQIQRECINLLRLRGIEPIVSRMDKRTSNNVGTPDLLFSVIGHDGYQSRVYACAVEVKRPGYHLNKEQRLMQQRMKASPNHWTAVVVHSVSELRTFLEGLGL